MLENILLSTAYYESFSKFATSLDTYESFSNEEMKDIAQNTVREFFISAEDCGASKDEIRALGKDLYLLVLSELNKRSL